MARKRKYLGVTPTDDGKFSVEYWSDDYGHIVDIGTFDDAGTAAMAFDAMRVARGLQTVNGFVNADPNSDEWNDDFKFAVYLSSKCLPCSSVWCCNCGSKSVWIVVGRDCWICQDCRMTLYMDVVDEFGRRPDNAR